MKLFLAITAIAICCFDNAAAPQVHFTSWISMTQEQMLQERGCMLMTIKNDTTSDVLVEEYERLHREIVRHQDERQFK